MNPELSRDVFPVKKIPIKFSAPFSPNEPAVSDLSRNQLVERTALFENTPNLGDGL